MDKPDVRALAEDVPADVKALAQDALERFGVAPMIGRPADWLREAFTGIVMRDRATCEAAKAEGRREGLEEACRVIADGMKCRCCGAYFLAANGHDESDTCARPSWDSIPQDELPAAIRALAKAEGKD